MRKDFYQELSPEVREKTKKNLVYVGIFSVIMLFAGFTSAYYVSMGDSFWLKYPLPNAFWISTVSIVLSSILLQMAIGAAKKNNQGALKAYMSITLVLAAGFVYFQFRGYGQLTEFGAHAVNNHILVTDGRYGDYYEVKYKGDFIEIDGNNFLLKGKPMSKQKLSEYQAFMKQFLEVDRISSFKVSNYGNPFVLYYENQPIGLINGKLTKPDGKELEYVDRFRLRDLAVHVRDQRGDFFIRGEMGKDFHIYFKGKEVEYKDRQLYYQGTKLSRYLQIKAMETADTATSYLYLITFLHVLHVIVAGIYLLRVAIRSFSGQFNSDNTLSLRMGAIFWHFLGVLWDLFIAFFTFYSLNLQKIFQKMAGHASKQIDASTLWGGKISPFSTSYGKLMMWFFLVSDALTFGGLLVAYGFTRHDAQDAWPIGEEAFNSLPFLGHGYPLIYVALMTFILIVSSVTMVLAVEAGHRMDKKGVIKWMIATIIGGFFFVGSQAWEWSHFIHGSEFGKIELADGSQAIVKGHFGEIKNFVVETPGKHHKKGDVVTEDLMHTFQHAAEHGMIKDGIITLHDGSKAKINKAKDEHLTLIIKKKGAKYDLNERIEGANAEKMYYASLYSGEAHKVIYGANLKQNEYGPQQYGQFFFFITGFHGFHVFSGVVINIIILLGVIAGTYHKRGHYEMVEKTGLYWHFVDLVWVFVFTFFYLI